ncbi:MAG: hypothetical protein IJ086_03815 [Clostridium sp.]|nr:hypothetical protein [Clostridium sp.]
MKWNTEKVSILKDRYAFANLDDLANELGATTKAVIRKAQKLKLYRAKNNQIFNDYKFCSLCKKQHHISEFYRNRAKYDGHEYYCKRYYKQRKEKLTTTLPFKKGQIGLRKGANKTDYVETRPRNPVVVVGDITGKICNSCKQFKSLDEFSRDKNGYAQKKATCRRCYKIRYSKKKVE